MAIITKITTQKNNRERYSIFINKGQGEEYAFGVDEDVLIQFRLRKGMRLSEEQLKQIFHEDKVKKAFKLCLSFLSYRMRTKFEMIQYMKQKNMDEQIISQVTTQLYAQRLLDDIEFAKSYVRDKKRMTTKGPLLLKQELQEKGISAHDIEQGLLEYSEDEQFQNAAKLARKRAQKAINESQQARDKKIVHHLLARGFSSTIAYKVIRDLPPHDPHVEMGALYSQLEKAKKRYRHETGIAYTNKLKQYLYRRGFPISTINQAIEEIQCEDDTTFNEMRDADC